MMWFALSLAAVACRSGEGAGAQPTPIGAGGSVEPSGSGGESTGGGGGTNGGGGSGGSDGSGGMPFFDALPLPEVGPAFEVGPPVDAGALIERVAFGSCNELARTQDFWTRINERNPQVFLSLGDLPYIDYGDTFAALAAVPGFKQLLALARTLMIWDDHDYGMNDGGAAYAGKLSSKKRFIDFWGGLGVIPPESPRRTREGNYDSLVLGPVGRQIQFIMLDNRYFKGVAPSGTVLGPEQWQWLAEELRRPATLRIIMSGIAAVGSSSSSDAWAQYPGEQQHLYDVIKDSGAKGVVIVSGDKHYAEISRRDVGLGYPLYDFTSSALNASNSYAPQPNLYRDAPASTTQLHNFGYLTINWAAADRPMVFETVNAITGAVIMSKTVSLTSLGSP
jgi:alkaline phosphatase D